MAFYFTDDKNFIINSIKNAEKFIKIIAFQFTSEEFVKYLIEKSKLGVEIELITLPEDFYSKEKDIWYDQEHNMAIYRSMPIVQAYLEDAKSSPSQRPYNKLYKYHYSKYQNWNADLLNKIKNVARLNKISY